MKLRSIAPKSRLANGNAPARREPGATHLGFTARPEGGKTKTRWSLPVLLWISFESDAAGADWSQCAAVWLAGAAAGAGEAGRTSKTQSVSTSPCRGIATFSRPLWAPGATRTTNRSSRTDFTVSG